MLKTPTKYFTLFFLAFFSILETQKIMAMISDCNINTSAYAMSGKWILVSLPPEIACQILSYLSYNDRNKVLTSLNKVTRRYFKDIMKIPEGRTMIEKLMQNIFVSIAPGTQRCMGLTENGEIFVWGANYYGQLGLGDQNPRAVPTLLRSLPSSAHIISIVSGASHCLALTTTGEVYTWGDNGYAQLGLGSYEEPQYPGRIQFPTSSLIDFIAAGGEQSFAIDREGRLYAWGSNEFGQLGLEYTDHWELPTEVSVTPNVQFKFVISTKQHGFQCHRSFAIDREGRLYAWGSNKYGQLGLGDRENRFSPTELSFFKTKKVKQIEVGNYHNLALTEDGELYAWGGNYWGELGLGDRQEREEPTLVNTFPVGTCIVKISTGIVSNLALSEDGTVYSWGANDHGQLGLGDKTERDVPTPIETLQNTIPITTISTGDGSSFAIDKNGRLYAWGNNICSQLGLGDEEGKLIPTQLRNKYVQGLLNSDDENERDEPKDEQNDEKSDDSGGDGNAHRRPYEASNQDEQTLKKKKTKKNGMKYSKEEKLKNQYTIILSKKSKRKKKEIQKVLSNDENNYTLLDFIKFYLILMGWDKEERESYLSGVEGESQEKLEEILNKLSHPSGIKDVFEDKDHTPEERFEKDHRTLYGNPAEKFYDDKLERLDMLDAHSEFIDHETKLHDDAMRDLEKDFVMFSGHGFSP